MQIWSIHKNQAFGLATTVNNKYTHTYVAITIKFWIASLHMFICYLPMKEHGEFVKRMIAIHRLLVLFVSITITYNQGLPYSKKLWRGKNFGEFGESQQFANFFLPIFLF